jgi:hypothetical protein
MPKSTKVLVRLGLVLWLLLGGLWAYSFYVLYVDKWPVRPIGVVAYLAVSALGFLLSLVVPAYLDRRGYGRLAIWSAGFSVALSILWGLFLYRVWFLP